MIRYVNGDFVSAKQAVLSVDERGVRFGDGVFETILLKEKCCYRWLDHMVRLQAGLDALDIVYDVNGLSDIGAAVIEKNNVANGALRIMISRGQGSQGYLPKVKGHASVVVEIVPLAPALPASIGLWLSKWRKISANMLPVHVKTMQGLNQSLARMEAQSHDCYEALQLSADKKICEGSSSSIFWYKGGRLYTPALEVGIVDGVMRRAVLANPHYEVEEGVFTLDDLKCAEMVFMSNVAWGILPVGILQPFGDEFNCDHAVLKDLRQWIVKDIEMSCFDLLQCNKSD